MSDRSTILSSGAVGLSVIGSVIGDQILNLAGPLLALAVHCWTESRKGNYQKRIDLLEKRIEELQTRLDTSERPSEEDLAWLRAGEPHLPVPSANASALVDRHNAR
jgi:hypothetical protein